jgi:hypothetical protein
MVKTHAGFSKIICVLITEVNEQIEMVKFSNGLIITNYHPVMHEGQWTFPVDVKASEKIYVNQYFNFVLEQGHSILVNDVFCITLGHGMKGPVLEHEYLGTSKIIDDLKTLEGWDEGRVTLDSKTLKRDSRTNLIVGISAQKAIAI